VAPNRWPFPVVKLRFDTDNWARDKDMGSFVPQLGASICIITYGAGGGDLEFPGERDEVSTEYIDIKNEGQTMEHMQDFISVLAMSRN